MRIPMIGCYAHKVQLAVNRRFAWPPGSARAFELLNDDEREDHFILVSIRATMKKLHCQDMYRMYKSACEAFDQKPLAPILPNATCWWGLLFMVTRYLDMHRMLEFASRQQSTKADVLAASVIDTPRLKKLESIQNILCDCWEVSHLFLKKHGTDLSLAHNASDFL